MTAYREPGFQDRRAAAAKARGQALAQLKAAPPLDPRVVAERAARERKREADRMLLAAQKAEARAAQVKVVAVAVEASEAELKAARDARYAARKARKS